MRCAVFLIVISAVIVFGIADVFTQVVKQVAPESYPPAARAVRASGKIGVTVNVDFNGKVVSAEAFSGHPLLRASAVTGAKKWIFEPVPEGNVERQFVLFFDYKLSLEEVVVEESDKESYSSLRLKQITPFEVELFNENQIPRFLKLPRKEGKISNESCPLHNLELSIEIQSVDCSGSNELLEADNKHSEKDSYYDAREAEFPKANIFVGCKSNGTERVETRFCKKCRIARQDWILRNGN